MDRDQSEELLKTLREIQDNTYSFPPFSETATEILKYGLSLIHI